MALLFSALLVSCSGVTHIGQDYDTPAPSEEPVVQTHSEQVRDHAVIERHDVAQSSGGGTDVWFWLWLMNSSRPWPYPDYAPRDPTPPRTDYTPRAQPPRSVPNAPQPPRPAPQRVAPPAPAPKAPAPAPKAPAPAPRVRGK